MKNTVSARHLLKHFCGLPLRILRLAQTLSLALVDRTAQAALQERVKELTCLYGLSQAIQQSSSLDEFLRKSVALLPPAFQFPDLACARIRVHEREYLTKGFAESSAKSLNRLVMPINVNNEECGVVELVYRAGSFEGGEDPFLVEEGHLLQGVSHQISLFIEGEQAELSRKNMEEQLRHADRLATIGELAAGVAHELNEPLSNILGFAQLSQKSAGIPEQTGQDLEKIVKASLQAREIVKKLLIFARQVPSKKSRVDLNQIIEEGLSLLKSRCAKMGIRIKRDLTADLPTITADPAQINQVLVNLVVNSIQAMPHGGVLTVRTQVSPDQVLLLVEDTGEGMGPKVMEHIFDPFFTTKEIGKGTGLGLSVVHGIVSAHGGDIRVESREGRGARFETRFPREDEHNKGPEA